jgi:hypothetical protein
VDFDANTLLASLVVGIVGLAVFVYGRKQSRLPHMLAGLVLMVFPYFVGNLILMTGIAVGVVAALVLVVRLGL